MINHRSVTHGRVKLAAGQSPLTFAHESSDDRRKWRAATDGFRCPDCTGRWIVLIIIAVIELEAFNISQYSFV